MKDQDKSYHVALVRVLWFLLGAEIGYEIGFSDEMLEGNEDVKVEGGSLVEFL